MLRDKALIPLSQQHHDALALCVYIERADNSGALDLAHWNREVHGAWEDEIRWHFGAEEEILFPACERYAQLCAVMRELLADHAALRPLFAAAAEGKLTRDDLLAFRQRLHDHVRKEERELFEQVQAAIPAEELAELGRRMDEYFERHAGGHACTLRPPRRQA